MKQKCMNCGELLPDDVRTCPFCEAEVPQAEPVGEEAEEPAEISEEEAISIEEGTLIDGRYEIEEKVGTGPKGPVFKAYDKALDRTVAIRIIPASLLRSPEVLTRFKDSLLHAQSFAHMNVAQVLQHGTWAGNTYVVTEFIEGVPLPKWLGKRGGSLIPSAALPIIKQVAAALDAAHAVNPPILHCLLNPSNIIVEPHGRVRVLDFGLSVLLAAPELKLSIEGDVNALAYLAPEQIRGEEVGPWTDIYSLGAVFYYLLCGRPPFTGDDARWKIMFEEAALPDELPDYVASVLSALLSKEPSARPSKAGDVSKALERKQELDEDRDQGEEPPAVLQGGASQPPNKGKGGMVGLAVAALAVIAVAFFFLRGGEEEKGASPVAPTPQVTHSAGELKEERVGTAEKKGKVSVASLAKEPPLLIVRSRPDGAAIFIDGKEAGKTPRTFRELTEGKHEVRVLLDRYEEYSKKLKLASGKRYTLTVKLVPEPYGDIEVRSEPDGADVFFDGKKVGVTPYSAERVPIGSHKVSLSLPCYRTLDKTVKIVPLKKLTLDLSLKPACGTVALASQPAGVRLSIDGKDVGKTPYRLENVPEGELLVALEEECYHPLKRKVKVVAGKELEYKFSLKPSCTNLKMTSKPSGADVFIDGKKVGKTPFVLAKFQKDKVKLRLEKECYAPVKQELALKPGKENSFSFELKRICGGLKVSSNPKGAKVFIDGKKLGKTPLDMPRLKKKRVRIELKKECYAPIKKGVDLIPGKVTRLDYKLKPVCGSIKVESNPAGAEVYLDGEAVGKTPLVKKGLKAGNVEVVVRQGMATWKKRVKVEAGKVKTVTAKLTKKDYWVEPVTGIEFVWVPGGCFEIGCGPWQDRCSADEKPLREVCVDGFWISRYEVTQAQWKKLMGNNPSKFKGDDRPVEQVSWNDAQAFIKNLEKAHGGKVRFALPSEAQWEYACRSGGKPELFCGGDDEYAYAWFRKNSDGETHEVGKKRPNGLKLYDMSGNVQEWCRDDYVPNFYATLAPKAKNPVATGGAIGKVIRGGAYDGFPWKCRSSSRYFNAPGAKDSNTGFRVVREGH